MTNATSISYYTHCKHDLLKQSQVCTRFQWILCFFFALPWTTLLFICPSPYSPQVCIHCYRDWLPSHIPKRVSPTDSFVIVLMQNNTQISQFSKQQSTSGNTWTVNCSKPQQQNICRKLVRLSSNAKMCDVEFTKVLESHWTVTQAVTRYTLACNVWLIYWLWGEKKVIKIKKICFVLSTLQKMIL